MVKFLDEKSCFIGPNVKIGDNVVIYENNHIEGDVTIGDNCKILPNNFIVDCKIGEGTTVHASVMNESVVGKNCVVGPYARLRKDSFIGDECVIGNFVEVKNSRLGKQKKACHLAYIGDADIGDRCNIGCGAIFINYNGREKHRTKVGNHVFIGSNCNIIAPVEIDDDSYICAGTTITHKVNKEDFVIGRVRQEIKPGYGKKYW